MVNQYIEKEPLADGQIRWIKINTSSDYGHLRNWRIFHMHFTVAKTYCFVSGDESYHLNEIDIVGPVINSPDKTILGKFYEPYC